MVFKKSLSVQKINPRALFLLVTWLLVAWILVRPLRGIGEHTYFFLGSLTNYASQGVSKYKSTLGELINSRKIIKQQLKTISLLEVKVHYLENQVGRMSNLKDLLSLSERSGYRTISANVIGRTADNWHKQIVIDQGTKISVMVGDAVLTRRGIVGQVVEVNRNNSIIQLISDPSYRIGCKVLRKNIIGILSGKTNSTGLLEFIPVGTDVKIGDSVVTSGISSSDSPPIYPSGHPLGRIKKVSKKKSKVSDLYIEVKLAEDLNSLSNVLVFSPQ